MGQGESKPGEDFVTVHGGGTAAAGASDVRSPVLERLEAGAYNRSLQSST
jgi:hypothetical protein